MRRVDLNSLNPEPLSHDTGMTPSDHRSVFSRPERGSYMKRHV